MPFLAPAIPFLAKAGIGLGASILGSKIGGKLTGPSGTEKTILDAQMDALKRGQQMSAEAFPVGMEAARGGIGALQSGIGATRGAMERLNPVIDYWSRLLSGNRGEMTSVLAPELNQIADNYRAAQMASANLTPRGGGRASLMQALPFQQARDVSTLLQTLRPQAAQGLGQTVGQLGGLAGQIGSLGSGLMSGGSNLLSSANQSLLAGTTAGRSILEFEAERRKRAVESGQGIGNFLHGILGNLKIGGGGFGGGGAKLPLPTLPGGIFDILLKSPPIGDIGFGNFPDV